MQWGNWKLPRRKIEELWVGVPMDNRLVPLSDFTETVMTHVPKSGHGQQFIDLVMAAIVEGRLGLQIRRMTNRSTGYLANGGFNSVISPSIIAGQRALIEAADASAPPGQYRPPFFVENEPLRATSA